MPRKRKFITVNVTEEDIRGAAATENRCPIARAFRREHPDWSVRVDGGGDIAVRPRKLVHAGMRRIVRRNSRARRFVYRFDTTPTKLRPGRIEPMKLVFELNEYGKELFG